VSDLAIGRTAARRFILGRQGLWPGRRWQGLEGVAHALRATEAVQIDPLIVIARNHDLTLHGRVIDYQPEHLLDFGLFSKVEEEGVVTNRVRECPVCVRSGQTRSLHWPTPRERLLF